LFGVGSTPIRARAAEEALVAGAAPAEVAEAAVRELDPPGDVHATASTRVRIARHLVERAVVRAQEELDVAG
jgi:CO/xanthine dehydrogenase FAD-binding subunit